MTTEIIMKDILINRSINLYFSKVEVEWRDDFRAHIYLTIMEGLTDPEKSKKIIQAHSQGNIHKWVCAVITNQLKSKTSPFYKIYKMRYKNIDFDISEEPKTEELNKDIIIKKILIELDNQHFADSVLYKLYRGIDPITNELKSPMTYGEISKKIGISYRSIYNSIAKTDKIIKSKIKI